MRIFQSSSSSLFALCKLNYSSVPIHSARGKVVKQHWHFEATQQSSPNFTTSGCFREKKPLSSVQMAGIANHGKSEYTYFCWSALGFVHGYRLIAASLIAVLLTGGVSAETLTLGAPTVEENRYVFPVELRASGEVAALDFRLRYDPAVFRPITADRGAMAVAADKLVTGNVPRPGEFKVVMMGLNQTQVQSGEVARLTLERIGNAEGAELAIESPTLATPQGEAIAADGSSQRLGGEAGEEQPPASEREAPPTAPTPTPAETGAGDSAATQARQFVSALPEAMARAKSGEAKSVAESANSLGNTQVVENKARLETSGLDVHNSEPLTESTTTRPAATPVSNAGQAETKAGPVTVESKDEVRQEDVVIPPHGLPQPNAGTPANEPASRNAALVWGGLTAGALGIIALVMTLRRRR